jgi:S1-C subfamily serine protease
VDNTPATQYGVQEGDIIVSLDNAPVRDQQQLERERDKHQPGEAFTLQILRGGQPMTINARFKSCSEAEKAAYEAQKLEKLVEMEERLAEMNNHFKNFDAFARFPNQERPILGVYEDETKNADGMVISEVIEGKGAAAAGLQAGDIITSVNGKKVTGAGTLRDALSSKKPGETVTIVYQRNGQNLQSEVKLSGDRAEGYTFNVKRDPCKVFIGVYTSNYESDGVRGVRVSGIIDDTPAKASNVQSGDIILALDGKAVTDHMQLEAERDKHQPGDAFTLTVLRNGAEMTINARFKSCDKKTDATGPVKETVEIASDDREPTPPARTVESTLEVVSLQAYPNPTAGPLNVRFEASAVPTTVRITDLNGKAVYTNVMNQFNGNFNERINLGKEIPGTFILSIQQGDKILSKNIILLPRA